MIVYIQNPRQPTDKPDPKFQMEMLRTKIDETNQENRRRGLDLPDCKTY